MFEVDCKDGGEVPEVNEDGGKSLRVIMAAWVVEQTSVFTT